MKTVRVDQRWVRTVGGAAILGVVLWRLGPGPFLVALHGISGPALVAAAGIGVLTTLCGAWRWTLVARGLGVALPLPAAVAACYRSQFVNVTLPGGVLGDVQRGVQHGHDVGDLSRGLRSVAWDRACGQVIQVVLALVVLAFLPSPVRLPLIVLGIVVVATALVVGLLTRMAPGTGTSPLARAGRTVIGDLRSGVLTRRAWPGIVVASVVAIVGHLATFVIAARSAGLDTAPLTLLPLALLVLLAMALPLNIAGWGPREGVAAAVFGAAGLGAQQGVSTAVVYGVLVLVASLPGAGLLLVARLGHRAVGAAHA